MSVYLILVKLQNLFRSYCNNVCVYVRARIHNEIRHFDSMGGIKINNKDRLRQAQQNKTAESKKNPSNDSRR